MPLFKKSAAYFGDVLWEEGNSALLSKVFPVFTVPPTKERLTHFIQHTLHCAYEESVVASGEYPLTHSRFNMILYGNAEIEDHVLMLLSNMFREEKGQVSIWLPYSFMPYLHCPTLPIDRDRSECTIAMNLMMQEGDEVDIDALVTLMQRWQNASGLLQVRLWMCDDLPAQPFYFCEGKCLLLVNESIQDSPVAVRILKPSAMLSFMAQRTPRNRRQISYNLAEPRQAEEAQEIMKNKLGDCRGAYIFTNTIFQWKQIQEGKPLNPESATQLMQETFQALATYDVPIVMSSDAIRFFAQTRGFQVPFWGMVRFEEEEMTRFLSMLFTGIKMQEEGRILLTNLSLPGLSALVFDEYIVIHSAAVYEQPEQVLIVPISLLQSTIMRFKDMVDNDAYSLSADKLVETIHSHIHHD